MLGLCPVATHPISALCEPIPPPVVTTPDDRVCVIKFDPRLCPVDAEPRWLEIGDCLPRFVLVGQDPRGILVREEPRSAEVPRAPRDRRPKPGGIIMVKGENRAVEVSADHRVIYVSPDASREIEVAEDDRTCEVPPGDPKGGC